MRIFLAVLMVEALIFAQSIPMGAVGGNASVPSAPASDATMVFWGEADCMQWNGSVCSTYANNHTFGVGDAWNDRSGNAHNMSPDSNFLNSCSLHTAQINSLPAVTFSNCAWDIPWSDSGNTFWTSFIVTKRANSTDTNQFFIGCNASSGNPCHSLEWSTGNTTYSMNPQQSLIETGFASIGGGTAVRNSSWNVMYFQFHKATSYVFNINATSDGSGSTSTGVTANSAYVGIERENGAFQGAFNGQIAAIIIYTGATDLTGAQILQTNGYLCGKYGLC